MKTYSDSRMRHLDNSVCVSDEPMDPALFFRSAARPARAAAGPVPPRIRRKFTTHQSSPTGVGPDERDTMRHSEHAQSLHSIALCSGRRGTEGGRCPGRGMHSVQVFSHWCARGLWASQPPGTVSGHTKGGVQSPRSSRDVHWASPPRGRRRVAAASPPRRRRVAA
jgi:hypothetical protein